MTPAIELARRQGVAHTVHSYDHDPDCSTYGTEAVEALGLDERRVFKTLVVDLGGRLAVAVLPVPHMLSMKLVAKAGGAKKAVMAEKSAVERATGYVLGGVSPLGQKKRLPTYIDASARDYPTIFVSAGRRGLEIEVTAEDLCRLTGGGFANLCQIE
ncbi:MAG: Cys-tRNA(Pro) deacylase [Acidihalobacter sp.]|jgi:Cys-tRNA(Pro)/Cys-tRNA(Cys) deacylase